MRAPLSRDSSRCVLHGYHGSCHAAPLSSPPPRAIVSSGPTRSNTARHARSVSRGADLYTKQEEFLCWLSEVKGVPQDACGQRELKEYFSDYCEDYNTGM